MQWVLQDPRPNPDGRGHNHREHGGLESVKDGRHRLQFAVGNIEPAQNPQDDRRRQDKEHTSDDSAPGAMQNPADVDRQLLRFGAGQQHAEIQGVKKLRFRNPFPALDQFLVHDRDLTGGTAETDEAQLQPEAQRFVESRGRRTGFRVRHAVPR